MKPIFFALPLFVLLLAVVPTSATTLYVDVNSTNPIPPYTNWSTAAAVIQDAVDASNVGDEVLVTNGIYATGGKAVYETMTNRVAVDKPLSLLSVNGPEFTVIQGFRAPSTLANAIRCAYLANGACLSGFSLIDGSTQDTTTSRPETEYGGGVFCAGTSAIVSNCVVSGNSARWFGGGCYSGSLINCTLSNNIAVISGGGASGSILTGCLVVSSSATRNWGGGVHDSILNRCTVTANHAGGGGGSFVSTLTDCAIVGNNAMFWGGGARGGWLFGCTVVGNTAGRSAGGIIAYGDTEVRNCIVHSNVAATNPNHEGAMSLDYSCTTPLPAAGIGNITNAPLFVDANNWADLGLQSNSPCINAGNIAYVTTTNDLDGNPRIVGGTVDMGAYEFQFPQSSISYAWLQQYGLPTDGSVDDLDGDHDLATSWQEWKTRTNPTNELSFLRMLSPQAETNGTLVRWESVDGHSYFLERATNAAEPFSLLQSNILGQPGMTSFTDTNEVGEGPALYRVGVPE